MSWADPILCDFKFGTKEQCDRHAEYVEMPCSSSDHAVFNNLHNRCKFHFPLECGTRRNVCPHCNGTGVVQ